MKKKNQRRITNIHTNKISYFSVSSGSNKRSKYQFGTFIKGGLTILISVLIIFTVVEAGTITPPSGTPSAQFYTLSEIYEFIINNTAATEGGHGFTFSDSLAGTDRTLTEIYNALASLISADQVKLSTTYLNVVGTLVPSGGDATTANVLTDKTFFGDSQADWNLQTGTMTNVGQQPITPGTSNTTITQGYHDGTGYCEGDADLITGNIKSGITLFGIDGDGNVVDTSSGDATVSQILSGYKAWVDGSEITGTFDPYTPQKYVRWDDWRYGADTTGSPFDEYTGEEATWTQTASGGTAASVTDNSVTVSLSSNTVKKDGRTSLYWTDSTATAVDNEFRYDATGQCNFTDTGTANEYCDNQDPLSAYTEDNDVSANDFCLNLELDADNADSDDNGLTGVETDWRLPSQKELMQAYIDGSANNLPNTGSRVWSATEHNNSATYVWCTDLDAGDNFVDSKNGGKYARCVRS